MSSARLRCLVEAWRLRARVALEHGPQLDALTEAASSRQALDELDRIERERLWPSKTAQDDGA